MNSVNSTAQIDQFFISQNIPVTNVFHQVQGNAPGATNDFAAIRGSLQGGRTILLNQGDLAEYFFFLAFRRVIQDQLPHDNAIRFQGDMIVQVTFTGQLFRRDIAGNVHPLHDYHRFGIEAFEYLASPFSQVQAGVPPIQQGIGYSFRMIQAARNYIRQRVDQRAAQLAQGHGQQAGSAGGLLLLIKSIEINILGLNLLVGCSNSITTGNRNICTFQLKTEQGDVKIFAHSVATTDNNCLIYALTIHHFYETRGPTTPYASYLSDRKRKYLEFLRNKNLLGSVNDLHPAITQQEMVGPVPFIPEQLVSFFKVHICAFVPVATQGDNTSRSNYTLKLFVDTRTDQRLVQRFPNLPCVKFILKDVFEEGVPSKHVWMILNDCDSIYNGIRRICDTCQVACLIDPLDSTKLQKHKCNTKKGAYNRTRLTKKSLIDTSTFLDPSEQQVVIEWDQGQDALLEELNAENPIPDPKFKLPNCQYDKNRHLLFIDFEVFFEKENAGLGIVYGVGIYELWSGNYIEYFGPHCMTELISLMKSYDFGVKLVAYNGARFDMLFMARHLLKDPACLVSDYIVNNAELLSMKIQFLKGDGTPNKHIHCIWDLCKFTQSSLRDACKSFGVENAKSHFPHSMMKSFDDLYYVGPYPSKDKYPDPEDPDLAEFLSTRADKVFNLFEECSKYLKLDVISMVEIYDKMNASFNKIFASIVPSKIQLSAYFSLSQLSYCICQLVWAKGNIQVYPPADVRAYNIFKSGYYGGRVDYGIRNWECEGYKELTQTPEAYNSIEEYLTYLDVTSLYPHVMMGRYYPYGKSYLLNGDKHKYINLAVNHPESRAKLISELLPYFEIDLSGRFSKPKKITHAELQKLPLSARLVCSYWEISFTPPADAASAYHMYRSKTGKLKSDLFPNRGWFYMPDVLAMLIAGYVFTTVHHVIAWENIGFILEDVIKLGKVIKDSGANGVFNELGIQIEAPDAIKKYIGKLLLNSLYGKFGQSIKDEVFQTLCTTAQVAKFAKENYWTDTIYINAEVPPGQEAKKVVLVKGTKREGEITTNKPTFLAGFVTAYSRFQNYFEVRRRIEEDFRLSPSPIKHNICYHDTDSFIVSSTSVNLLPPYLLVQPGEMERFGQMKDDLVSASKKYKSLKTQLPIKIIKLIVLGKKMYYVEYMLPDGTIEHLQACKGISQEVPKEAFERISQTPTAETFTTAPRISMNKRFVTSQSLGKAKKLALDAEVRDLKKSRPDENSTTLMDDIIDLTDTRLAEIALSDYDENVSFTVALKENETRTLNATPSHDKAFDPTKGRFFPYSPTTPQEIIDFNEELIGSLYTPEAAIRSSYKSVLEVKLTVEMAAHTEMEEIEEEEEEWMFGADEIYYD